MAVFQFHTKQKIPASTWKVWAFMSSPRNLTRITPKDMGFEITTQYLRENMHEGQIITYKVKPLLGFKTTWVTEITHVEDGLYFVDEQRKGPYKMWHHEHWIHPIEGGVLMEDLVTYEPPFGFIGKIINRLVIRKKLNQIFEYRRKAVNEIFGEYKGES